MGISLNPSTLLSGQGIDVSSLVQEVLSQSSGQLTGWQNELTTLQSQANDLNGISNDLNSLATAVQALSDPLGALTSQSASSSNSGILTASATPSAAAGTHEIVVSNLATPGLVYTNDFAGGTTGSILPSGTSTGEIDLQIGGTSGTTHAITITAGSNDTLDTLASYINSQNWGVTASVVTDMNGSRLAVVSQSTGSPSALAITANTTNLAFNTPSGAANAVLSIDGVPYTSATNTITGAITGVTLNLTSAAPNSPVQVTVGVDSSQVTQVINNFVSAYNQVIKDFNAEYAIDPTTNSEGPLGSDAGLRGLQSSLLADAAYSVSGNGGYVNLASLGISTNNDGTLTVDSSQLSSALSTNPSAVLNFFQNATSTGFADKFHSDLTGLTDPTTGPLSVDLQQNKTEQQDLNNSISNFQTQLATEQAQLTQEYSQVNASLQSYPLLLQQVTETLASMGSNSSSDSNSSPTLTSGL